jgi:hypothetical protein
MREMRFFSGLCMEFPDCKRESCHCFNAVLDAQAVLLAGPQPLLNARVQSRSLEELDYGSDGLYYHDGKPFSGTALYLDGEWPQAEADYC